MYDYSECKFVFVFFSGKMVKNHYENLKRKESENEIRNFIQYVYFKGI